jgi:hypothetical protein
MPIILKRIKNVDKVGDTMKTAQINMLKSIGYLMLSVFMLTVATYAWFTISYENKASLTAKTSGVEAEYTFYAYQNKYHTGSNALNLYDNTCEALNTDDMCYKEVTNPITPELIEGSVAPGERFSFAIAINSIGTNQGYVNLTLGRIESIGYDIEANKIQKAFGYEVTKISHYQNNVETEDHKSFYTFQSFRHFETADNVYYDLVTEVPMIHDINYPSTVIIYFDIYYDPYIFGQDLDGTPHTNSHAFINQSIIINDIYMSVKSTRSSS